MTVNVQWLAHFTLLPLPASLIRIKPGPSVSTVLNHQLFQCHLHKITIINIINIVFMVCNNYTAAALVRPFKTSFQTVKLIKLNSPDQIFQPLVPSAI